jgi:hypothetical protein
MRFRRRTIEAMQIPVDGKDIAAADAFVAWLKGHGYEGWTWKSDFLLVPTVTGIADAARGDYVVIDRSGKATTPELCLDGINTAMRAQLRGALLKAAGK